MSVLSFHSVDLNKSLPELIALDEVSIEESMWLGQDSIDLLSKSEGFAVMCWHGNALVGGAYGLPSRQVAHELVEADPEFTAAAALAYIYSVVVHPDHRRRGVGTQLRKKIKDRAFYAGHSRACTHVRMDRDWHKAGRALYQPKVTRLVENFWPDDEYPHVEYQEFSL